MPKDPITANREKRERDSGNPKGYRLDSHGYDNLVNGYGGTGNLSSWSDSQLKEAAHYANVGGSQNAGWKPTGKQAENNAKIQAELEKREAAKKQDEYYNAMLKSLAEANAKAQKQLEEMIKAANRTEEHEKQVGQDYTEAQAGYYQQAQRRGLTALSRYSESNGGGTLKKTLG